jgi:hypothetical protein
VFTLRCTAKVFRQLRTKPTGHEGDQPTTVLGDWYANLVSVERRRVFLCVSEKSLLPVLLPLANPGRLALADRVAIAAGVVLAAIGVDPRAIERELAEMKDWHLGTTASRAILGSMNDFAFLLQNAKRPGEPLPEMERWLAEVPCGPLRMERPIDVTRTLFDEVARRR